MLTSNTVRMLGSQWNWWHRSDLCVQRRGCHREERGRREQAGAPWEQTRGKGATAFSTRTRAPLTCLLRAHLTKGRVQQAALCEADTRGTEGNGRAKSHCLVAKKLLFHCSSFCSWALEVEGTLHRLKLTSLENMKNIGWLNPHRIFKLPESSSQVVVSSECQRVNPSHFLALLLYYSLLRYERKYLQLNYQLAFWSFIFQLNFLDISKHGFYQ